MDKFSEEKRSYPRTKTSLRVDVSKDNSGNSVDIGEGGLSLSLAETISSPKISLQICFPDRSFKFKTNARLVWKRDIEESASLYGVEFVGLDKGQKEVLRKEIIKTQIIGLLNDIKNPEIRSQVSRFFLKDMLRHISELNNLFSHSFEEKRYSLEVQEKFNHLNNEILLKGYCLEELLSDKSIMQKVKDDFRHLVGVWVYKSVIVKRAFDKPRGYPGDYKMLEIVYDNKLISKNIGMYSDANFLRSPYAVAVRIRKNRLKELLLKFINETKLAKIYILNIACGSCREIRELLPNLKTKSSIMLNCLDWDEEALKFSEDTLLPITPKNVEFKFIKQDIMNIVKDESVAQSFGKQNLVYSIGLIDYLPDRVLKKVIYALYKILEKDGKLILTHKDRDKTFPSLPPDWFCDWKFVSRNKDEAIRLFYNCGLSEFSLFVESDDFGYIHYFTLVKK